MFSINKPYQLLFFLGLFFFPFNSFEGIKEFGEFKNESGAYFFLIGFFLLVFKTKIVVPFRNQIFQAILLFVFTCFLSVILNFDSVATSYFKYTGGINRFIRQFVSLLLSSLIFFLFYYNVLVNMSIKEILFKVRKIFFYSLCVASVIGFFEILAGYYGIALGRKALQILDYFPFFEKKYISNRISSICDEPPFFAIYLITVSGWMFSYILTMKSLKRYIPMLMVLVLTFYSGSRTGLIVIAIQVLIFFSIISTREIILKNALKLLVIVPMLSLILFLFNAEKIIGAFEEKFESLDFKNNLTKSVSNQSRFGMQYAAIQVFLEQPVIGVGFGQQTYYSRFHYPAWAVKNNYEFEEAYKNPAVRAFPPSYNMYTRLLAEVGLIGTLAFLYLICISLKRARHLTKQKNLEIKTLGIILVISLSGLYINLLQIDTFRLYGVWLSLAILIIIFSKKEIYE